MSSDQLYDDANRFRASPDVPLFEDPADALKPAQDVIGRKWHPVIVYHLLERGPRGFSALKDVIDGISSKMLSESLEDLEEKGVLERRILSERPVRVEYSLTDEGQALGSLLTGMIQWGTDEEPTHSGHTASDRSLDWIGPQAKNGEWSD